MLLTLSTTHAPATDLGYLLHKSPGRVHSSELAFGHAHVFYPEATDATCTAALMLEIDAVGLVRGRGDNPLAAYVSDRPYVASSFLAVAIARVYGSALSGRSKERPALAATPLPLEAHVSAVAPRGGEKLVRALFEPLGWHVDVERVPLDAAHPEWGEGRVMRVGLRGTATLASLLSHLYVLLPVLDDDKHYYVDEAEVQKLLRHGREWLEPHPERELVTRRYLKHQRSLVRSALAQLEPSADEPDDDEASPSAEARIEESLSLDARRRAFARDMLAGVPVQVHAAFQAAVSGSAPVNEWSGAYLTYVRNPSADVSPDHSRLGSRPRRAPPPERLLAGARRVADLGCGEGKLAAELAKLPSIESVLALDVSTRALEHAATRIARLPEHARRKVSLLPGSLVYRDHRLRELDAVCCLEVIEHLEPERLDAFERALFGDARPRLVLITTPNREHNALFASLPAGRFRHADHRFEWTRAEHEAWARAVAARHGYDVRFAAIGDDHPELGPPTQASVFTRSEAS